MIYQVLLFPPMENQLLHAPAIRQYCGTLIGKINREFNMWFPTSASFSPDGKLILIGSADGSVSLWGNALPLKDFLHSNKIEGLTAKQKKQFGIN